MFFYILNYVCAQRKPHTENVLNNTRLKTCLLPYFTVGLSGQRLQYMESTEMSSLLCGVAIQGVGVYEMRRGSERRSLRQSALLTDD